MYYVRLNHLSNIVKLNILQVHPEVLKTPVTRTLLLTQLFRAYIAPVGFNILKPVKGYAGATLGRRLWVSIGGTPGNTARACELGQPASQALNELATVKMTF